MNTVLEKIKNESELILQMDYVEIYCKIIDYMMKDVENNGVLYSFNKIKTYLTLFHLDDKYTPEELSLEYFGFNLFQLDIFDYYLMVYADFQDKLMVMFDELEKNEKWNSHCDIHKMSILSIFDESPNYMHRGTRKNRPYRTMLFQDFLEERKDWIKFLDRHINMLNNLIGE
jgi:hypothetical protein